MRRTGLLVFLVFAVSQQLLAQSLAGTWISDALLLKTVHFSLTFRSDMTYQIDCTLGRTTGTYVFTEDKINFTPLSVGISAGHTGDTQLYFYIFGDENTLYLHANGVKVKLRREEPSQRQSMSRPPAAV